MFNLHLTAEQIEFRDTLRSFATNEIRPAAIHPDRLEPFEKPLMRGLLDQASELGLRALTLSEDAGGVGADTLTTCIVLEELATGDVDIATTLGQTALLGGLLFDTWTTADQRERFLPRFVDDATFHLACVADDADAQTGWCYHEDRREAPGARPTAVGQGGDWVIEGSVSQVVNAPIAELLIVPVRKDADDGMAALLVPRGAPGLEIHEAEIRWHHGSAATVEFNSCKIPNDNLLGWDGDGSDGGGDYAVRGAVQRAAVNLGVGRSAYEAALDYTKIRRQGGRDIVEHQAIGKMIADMAVKLELCRTMIWKAAWVADHPEFVADPGVADLPLHTVASVFTAETVHQVTLLAAECFGAMAVMRDMPMQKYVDDGLVFLHSDTNDIATRLRIAEAAVAYRRSTAA